ncbi:MAG TPA: ABC transporter permease [Acidobacteriota bacterium]
MLMLRLAFRNIFRQKRRSLLTFLTILFGFVLSSLVIGMTFGTFNGVVNTFTRTNLGHIQIHEKDYLDRPALYRTVDDIPRISRLLGSLPEVEAWAPRCYAAGLASLGDRTSGVQVIGIDPERENGASRFNKKIKEGRLFRPDSYREVILGTGLAKYLKARLGDEVVIVSQAADGSIANDAYRLVGLLESGSVESDRVAFYMPIKSAQELFALDGRAHEIIIVARRLDQVDALAGRITAGLQNPGLSAQTWKEYARSFYQYMMRDRRSHRTMTYIILMIVAIGVLNTILMSVLERRREYGLLKAVGTKPRHIFALILLEANILALLAVAAGSVLALALNGYLAVHGFRYAQEFTFGGMQLSRAYSAVNVDTFAIPAATVLVFTSLVAFFPAWKASRLDPARTMRLH